MTPYAVFAAAMLAPVAVVMLVVAVVRQRRHERAGPWRVVLAVASGVFLLLAGLAIAGWAAPDAFDRLSVEERRAVGPALAASPECGILPFARVVDVSVAQTAERGLVLRYSCGLTPVGLPRFTNEAHCADGQWTGPGLREQWSAGSCVEFLGR